MCLYVLAILLLFAYMIICIRCSVGFCGYIFVFVPAFICMLINCFVRVDTWKEPEMENGELLKY